MNTTIRHRAHLGVAVAVLAAARLHRDAADDHRPARPVRAGKGRPAARELSIDRARREFDYEVGELAYWSPGNDFEMTIEPLD